MRGSPEVKNVIQVELLDEQGENAFDIVRASDVKPREAHTSLGCFTDLICCNKEVWLQARSIGSLSLHLYSLCMCRVPRNEKMSAATYLNVNQAMPWRHCLAQTPPPLHYRLIWGYCTCSWALPKPMNCSRYGISPRCVVREIARGTTIKRLSNKKIHYWGTTALDFSVLLKLTILVGALVSSLRLARRGWNSLPIQRPYSTARSVVEISCARALWGKESMPEGTSLNIRSILCRLVWF